jgi:HSP20 family protein
MNQSEPFAGIDEAIGQVEKLYQAVTGTNAPAADAPYAPIPAERDPSQHVEEQLNRLLDLLGPAKLGRDAVPTWSPPVTVWESDAEILVCIDLPGLRRDQVEVAIQGNYLTVSGVRPPARDGFRLRSSEPGVGAFRRTLFVSAGINGSEPSAQMRDGVLELRLPRPSHATTPKAVPIH